MDNFIARIGLKVDSSDGDIQNQINKKIKDARVKAAIELHMNNEQLRKEVDIIKNQLKTDLNIDINDKIALQSIKNVRKEYEGLKNQYQKSITLDLDKTGLTNNINSFLKNNTKLSNELSVSLIDVKNRVEDADSIQLKDLKKEFRNITSKAKALGQTGDSVFTKLGKNVKQFVGFLGSATIVMSGINLFRNMVTEVKNLDKAMISLRKVTDETESTYRKFLNTAANSAKNLGASISDIIEMTADWARAGYGLKDSSALAEISTIFQNVAEVDVSRSVSDIITPMKAFNIEASKAITIVDALNEVDNKFSVSAAGIGEGLSNSASALALAGNDLNETIALLTGGAEITQNASEMGKMYAQVA